MSRTNEIFALLRRQREEYGIELTDEELEIFADKMIDRIAEEMTKLLNDTDEPTESGLLTEE